MKVMLDKLAFMPTRAHEEDAGLDLYSPIDIPVEAGGSATIDTGVHVQIPKSFGGLVVSKSGLNVKNSITSTGLIDEGYTGSIVVKLYNHGKVPYMVRRGDKISQLVIFPAAKPELVLVNEFEKTERGDKGFGSTGK